MKIIYVTQTCSYVQWNSSSKFDLFLSEAQKYRDWLQAFLRRKRIVSMNSVAAEVSAVYKDWMSIFNFKTSSTTVQNVWRCKRCSTFKSERLCQEEMHQCHVLIVAFRTNRKIWNDTNWHYKWSICDQQSNCDLRSKLDCWYVLSPSQFGLFKGPPPIKNTFYGQMNTWGRCKRGKKCSMTTAWQTKTFLL